MSMFDDENLGSREHWQQIAETVTESENLREATNRISKAMYDANPQQDYIDRGAQARQLVETIGVENTSEAVSLIQQGKSPDEIVTALKKSEPLASAYPAP